MATKRLIDANELPLGKFPEPRTEWHQGWNDALDAASAQATTVDVVEVVHGRWLYDSRSGKYCCSACDENALSFKKDTLYDIALYEVCLTDYCPNCGAKMDGDGNA